MKRLLVVWMVALCLAAVPAVASTFVHTPQKALVAQADAVVQGQVVQLDTFWSEDGRVILTEATVAIDEVLVGKAPTTVTVRTFGGKIGDVGIEAHGFPKFEDGERVILFLSREPSDDSLRVLGYQEGQFRVVTRRDGVTLAVPMVEENARYVTPDGRPAPEPKSVEINQWKAQIKSLAERVRGQAIAK